VKHRRFGLVVSLAVAATAAVAVIPARTAVADVAPAPVLTAAPDYATNVFADPWTFDNADWAPDANSHNLKAPSVGADGTLSFTATGLAGYTLLFPGYPGSYYRGRDGMVAANRISTSTYTMLHMHVFTSSKVDSVLRWSTCNVATVVCTGAKLIKLSKGWNDVNLDISSLTAGMRVPWRGKLTMLQLWFQPTTSLDVKIDYLRLVAPSTADQLSWSSPDGRPTQLWWSDSPTFTEAVASQHAAPITGALTTTKEHGLTSDLSGYPPNSYFFAVPVGDAPSSADEVAQIVGQPLPVITSPSAAGCGDYAVSAIGHPWSFDTGRSRAKVSDGTRVSYTKKGGLTATNSGPVKNDPYVLLPLGKNGINATKWHRLTVVESYDGAFNLGSKPGGGTMARVLWKNAGNITYSQTNDLVTYAGKQTLFIDLGLSPRLITDPAGTPAQRKAFKGKVTVFRWDPNEDPGPRRWHLYSVRLAADCAAKSTFDVTWNEQQYNPGSTVTISATKGANSVTLASDIVELPGANTYRISAAALRAVSRGNWTINVTSTNPPALGGQSRTETATGPLVIS
jgi:hypothetical protein